MICLLNRPQCLAFMAESKAVPPDSRLSAAAASPALLEDRPSPRQTAVPPIWQPAWCCVLSPQLPMLEPIRLFKLMMFAWRLADWLIFQQSCVLLQL